MSTTPRATYVVTGATGNVGRAVVSALLESGRRVRAVVRSASATLPPQVESYRANLDDAEALASVLEDADALFLLAGFQAERELILGASRLGVGRVVLLTGGGAASRNPDNAISRFQLAAEARVRGSPMDWTVLRPTAYFTNVLRWPAVHGGGVVRAAFADLATAAIDPADVGRAAAVAMVEDGHAGRTYRLTGPEPLKPADQVATLADVLGIDLSLQPLTNEEALNEMAGRMPRETAEAFYSFYADGELDESQVLPTFEEVTGRKPQRFADWVAANPARFS